MMPSLPVAAGSKQSHAPQVPNKFTSSLIEHFMSIIDEATKNLQYIETHEYNDETKTKFHEILDKGIWYPQDYLQALEKCEFQSRINLINNNNRFHFYYGYVPEQYFQYDKSNFFTFQMKNNVKPSDALSSIGKQWSILECQSVYMLAFHRALFDFIGREKYDQVFAHNFIFSKHWDSPSTSPLFSKISIKDEHEIKIGDKCYFSNIKGYANKHRYGNSDGFHVIYSKDPLKPFLGFGLTLEGSSKQEVERALFNAYNQPPLEDRNGSLSDHTIDWEQFNSLEGGSSGPKDGKLLLLVVRPNIERIKRLAKTPLKRVSKMFQEIKKEDTDRKKEIKGN